MIPEKNKESKKPQINSKIPIFIGQRSIAEEQQTTSNSDPDVSIDVFESPHLTEGKIASYDEKLDSKSIEYDKSQSNLDFGEIDPLYRESDDIN